jgi:polysaccharide deacetylase 2 family uncharacterized protein YibQ
VTRAPVGLLALVTLGGAAAPAGADERPAIAIIVDDLGHAQSSGRRVVELPGPVTCAVLPHTPRAEALAEAAFAAGKDVLLHLPLEPVASDGRAEPGGLMLDMTRRELAETFAASLAAVPHAVGVNTHRGSLLTRHPGHMTWLMEEILARGDLVFVDSRTTAESVALAMAREAGVPAVKRDVFLDPDPSPASVEREFARLKRLARREGMAVAIGHPYPATLALLERELPRLEDEGFRLVGIREYVRLAGLRGAAGNPGPALAIQSSTQTTTNAWQDP